MTEAKYPVRFPGGVGGPSFLLRGHFSVASSWTVGGPGRHAPQAERTCFIASCLGSPALSLSAQLSAQVLALAELLGRVSKDNSTQITIYSPPCLGAAWAGLLVHVGRKGLTGPC